jgi:uroporphyrinogen decarboxylase
MNSKELILEAFSNENPSRVPVAFFGCGAWTIFNSGNTFSSLSNSPEKMANIIIQTNRELKSDMVFCGSGYNNFHAAALGGEMKFRDVGPPDLAVPFISSVDDLNNLTLDKLDSDKIIATIRKATKIVSDQIGDKTMVTTTSWGPFTLGGQIRGVEAMMRDVFKDKELVKEVVDFSTSMIERFFLPLIENNVIDTVTIADPTASGDLISRTQFEEFSLPYLKRLIKTINRYDANSLLHICGNTGDKLDLMADTKATCFSLDYKVDLSLAKKALGDKMCISGNVDPVSVLSNGGPNDVVKASKECIDKGGPDGYILMPGCDHPPTVPKENLQALTNTARNWVF